MRRIILLISILFSITLLNAQHRYHFRVDAPQGFSVVSNTATNLSLHYAINEMGIADIDNGDVKGQEIVLKGSFGSFAEGLPNLPAQNRYIAVPQGATVSVEVRENGSRTLDGSDLLPAAEVVCNATNRMPKLRKDMSVFGVDAAFPKENVTIVQSTRIRGLDVVLLSVTPFRYNPVRKTLEVIYDMDIEVRFEGGNGQFGEARYRNPAWDGILRDLVINGDMLPEANYYDLVNQSTDRYDIGCEYLIIAPDDDSILAWADTLRRFRNRQGVITKVVTTTDCGGNDANAIKRYIQYGYDHWIIPPAAIMIFGGMTDTLVSTWPVIYAEGRSGIPAFPLIFLNYNDTGENHNYFSDNPYADMNGDSIPDIAISRLPAITLKDYATEVNKIIQYETNPPTNPLYYDQPIISSGHEYNKWFLITSQSVDGFYRNKLGKRPKNFYMQYYYAEQEPSDTLWSTGYNTDAVVEYFGPEGEQYIAQHLDTLSQWQDMFRWGYLLDALNQGSFLTLYRDHSSTDLWACPWVEVYEIQYLKQDTVPTYLISIGCHTGSFSYTYHNGNLHTTPLIAALSNDAVGALGGIGAATVTHSHFNDILTWGCIDYIWPDFMSSLGSATEPDFVRPVYALVAGKLFLNQHAFMPDWWPAKITTTHNVFHDIGEAYLTLFTEVPQDLSIVAPNQQSVGQPQYNFTAEEGTLVCLSRGGEILQAAIATGQPQSLALTQMAVGDQFTLTATKQNRFRFEQVVTVIPSGHGMQEQDAILADFFPNPTDGKVNLVIGEELQGETVIEVYNLWGERMLMQTARQLRQGETVSLDLSKMVSGMYIIKLSTENGCCSKKVSVW